MIEYQPSGTPLVRCIESEVAGRRVAAHALPYSGEAGEPAIRFDPLDRSIVLRRTSGRVAVGPPRADAWALALERCPAGPVLVGPGSPVEEIRGAYRAAAEGATGTGRPVYLLDPDPAGLPPRSGRACVALFSWIPDGGRDPSAGVREALGRGFAAGGLLPIVPAWTDAPAFLAGYLDGLAAAGAQFAAAVASSGEADARRRLVEARSRVDPESADRFFEKVHHCDWPAVVRAGLKRFREEAARRGLATIPPRPLGAAEPPGNSAAAARLEERAREVEEDEHRSALFYAAARWIDESRRDLTPVVEEGNFAKVFPFGALAGEAEAAFRAGRDT
ncbi:MAG TPA: hypothetical protein VFF17_12140 [Thermoanaerobaculia bacterium]|nr:hypothetical protein [Thermoanaerobaculia bacterium]